MADFGLTTPSGPVRIPAQPTTSSADQPRRLTGRTTEDTAALLSSVLGSLALTWLCYVALLGWSGKLGFVVCWYGVFLAMYAAVSRLQHPLPQVVDHLAGAAVAGAAAVVGAALVATVLFTLLRGHTALAHANFFNSDMAGVRPTAPLTHGGVRHSIYGSGIEIGIATLISLPLGVGTAVYMTEVGGRVSKYVRTVVEAMTALPDILAGLFVYTFLIIGLHWERTGFAVALALSVTMTPVIARSAEVVLRLVPAGLREASLALGASQWQTVRRVVLPTARAGLATSLILGIARIAGETAPLLIVSGASTFTNVDPFHQPMNSLPVDIFASIRSGEPLYVQRGYAAAMLLLLIVVVLFVTARFLARDRSPSR